MPRQLLPGGYVGPPSPEDLPVSKRRANYEFSREVSAFSVWAQPLQSYFVGQIDPWASSFQHLPYVFMGQLVFYVKHLSARQSWAAHLSENVTALWLVREGEKNKLIIVRLGSCQGKKAFFVIYLLVFIHRMVNLQLARRSGSNGSCTRENNLFHMMSTWGGLVSNYFLQLLSNSRTEKSREGRRRRDASVPGELHCCLEQADEGSPCFRSPPRHVNPRWSLHLGRRSFYPPSPTPKPGVFSYQGHQRAFSSAMKTILPSVQWRDTHVANLPRLTLAVVGGGEFWNLKPGSTAHTKQFPVLKARDLCWLLMGISRGREPPWGQHSPLRICLRGSQVGGEGRDLFPPAHHLPCHRAPPCARAGGRSAFVHLVIRLIHSSVD